MPFPATLASLRPSHAPHITLGASDLVDLNSYTTLLPEIMTISLVQELTFYPKETQEEREGDRARPLFSTVLWWPQREACSIWIKLFFLVQGHHSQCRSFSNLRGQKNLPGSLLQMKISRDQPQRSSFTKAGGAQESAFVTSILR